MPAHIAAAVCVLTLNIFATQAVVTIGITQAPFERAANLKRRADKASEYPHPLSLWSTQVQTLSGIPVNEIKELYTTFLGLIDKNSFKNKLAGHKELWL